MILFGYIQIEMYRYSWTRRYLEYIESWRCTKIHVTRHTVCHMCFVCVILHGSRHTLEETLGALVLPMDQNQKNDCCEMVVVFNHL